MLKRYLQPAMDAAKQIAIQKGMISGTNQVSAESLQEQKEEMRKNKLIS